MNFVTNINFSITKELLVAFLIFGFFIVVNNLIKKLKFKNRLNINENKFCYSFSQKKKICHFVTLIEKNLSHDKFEFEVNLADDLSDDEVNSVKNLLIQIFLK